MKKNKKIIGIIFAILSISGAWVFVSNGLSSQAPDISFNTLKGEKISLQSLRGKPSLITFWATDCPGCIKEIPHLKELHNNFSEQGLNIIAVAMHYDRPDNVIAMSKEKQLPYHIALDPLAQASKAFGNVRLTPTSFLIAADGSIIMQKIGEFDQQDMQQRIQQLLIKG